MKKLWLIALIVTTSALAFTLAACQAQPAASAQPTRHVISLYGFSVEREVMEEEILPAFANYWELQTGEKVSFRTVFTSSEVIADEIIKGELADVALLSNDQHATWLQINDFTKTDWRNYPNQGVFSTSPIVIVVRSGNPLGITDWTDLTNPNVEIIQPDPKTSGGAQWAMLAEYGSDFRTSNDHSAATQQLLDIQSNIISYPSSARGALREFLFGQGDVLITYEQDALLAQSRGAAIEIIMPPSTIMSEHVAVVVDRNVKSSERKVVDAFISFLWSDTAQRALTRFYFRSITDDALNQAVPEFQNIENPFTVDDLGGWDFAYPEIINSK
ncbi:MAG: sulfate ABC transporter substrate-binding protein [Anaerolineales bacterium]|nr:sulfate ABC transporter substrate-binding protein [Anaerolineales bacterium]